MTAVHWPWSALGIAPTEDRKTIREAYSRLLKALDHEAETEAYMGLRDARDAALSGHFLHPPGEDREDEDDFGLGQPLADDGETDEPARGDAPLTDSEPAERPVFTVEYDDEDDKRFKRVVDLFLGEGEMTREESLELRQLLDLLLADERMSDLGHYARVESWLAQLLADRYPRGADLFPRIAAHFDWGERAHELGIHPAIPWLFNAHEGVSVVRKLETPGHDYHREWVELCRGKITGPLWLRSTSSQRMAQLMATIRRDYPWLEQEHWQPDLVARWDKRIGGGGVSGPNPWMWIVLVAVLFVMLGRAMNGAPEIVDPLATAATEQRQAEAAIDGFIASRFPDAEKDGRTAETLRRESPRVHAALSDIASRQADPFPARDRIMMHAIIDGYYDIIDKLPYEQQVADAKLRVATMKSLSKNPKACAAFARHPRAYWRDAENADAILSDYQYRMFSIVHEYGEREWSPVTKNLEIPGEIVGKIVNRSGLSDARLRAAIGTDDAPDADVCAAMRGLYEIMTEIPEAQASKILPALM